LQQILPYLMGLNCAHISCTQSTSVVDLVMPQRFSDNSSGILLPEGISVASTSQPHQKMRSLSNTPAEVLAEAHNVKRHRRGTEAKSTSDSLRDQGIAGSLIINDTITYDTDNKGRRRNRSSTKRDHAVAQVLIVENIQEAPQKTIEALLEIMTQRQIAVKGFKYNTPQIFMVIVVTGGKAPLTLLPPQMLDYFLVKVPLFTPLYSPSAAEPPAPAFTEEEIVVLRAAINEVHVGHDIQQYMRSIVVLLRNNPDVISGPSPRASLAFSLGVSAAAVLAGQRFATPSHVLTLAPQVLNHRVTLSSPKREIGFANTDESAASIPEVDSFQIINSILETLDPPL